MSIVDRVADGISWMFSTVFGTLHPSKKAQDDYWAKVVAEMEQIEQKGQTQKEKIYSFISANEPVTVEEVRNAFPAWPASSVRARIAELQKADRLMIVGVYHPTKGQSMSLYSVAE